MWPRALDKREYLVVIRDNFCEFCIKTSVTPNRNCLNETGQMRGHNIWFQREINKNYPSIIIKYSSYLRRWQCLGGIT